MIVKALSSTRTKAVFMATKCDPGTCVQLKAVLLGPVHSDNDGRHIYWNSLRCCWSCCQ